MGAPRITAELNDQQAQFGGSRINRKRVARLMRCGGIVGYRKRRRVRTTVPDQTTLTYPDLFKRDVTADAPNRKYVGDMTYLPLADRSNLYLATVIDCYSRRLVGWALRDHMRTSLVVDALQAAAHTRGNLKGAIFHCDHGSVYTSKDFAAACKNLGVTQSMGAVGTSADNALAESFNAAFKREVLMTQQYWPDALTCQRQAFRWLTLYRHVIRWIFTVVFASGAAVHLGFALFSPESYAPFSNTAVPWLSHLWSTFVMPNIRWLALLMAFVEACIAAGLASRGRRVQVAAAVTLYFFAFLLLLGYPWPTASFLEDFAKNRATTLILAAAVAPLLLDTDAKPLRKRVRI